MPSDSTPAREAVEFQPDALEIQYETLPWYGRSGILWGLLAVAALFVWACLSKVEVIITGPGRVVADRNIVMKPLERSVIKSIEVAEGDIVQKGQVLINFDPEINLANAERLEAQIRSRKVEFERCQAEFADQPFSPALDQDENVRWQIAIYQLRQTYFRERLNFYAEREKQLLAAWQSTQESLNKQREILSSIQTIESMYSGLRDQQIVSLKELLEVSITRMQTESELNRLRLSLQEQEHQRQSLLADKNAFVEEWRNGVAEKLFALNLEISQLQQECSKARQLVSYVQLRAPCEAMVYEIAAFSSGSAVREAEALITLVPLDSPLEIAAEIRPQDISRVQVGSTARVKLTAFPFQRHGTLQGKVRTISANTFLRPAGERQDETAYYRVHLTLAGELKHTDQNFHLLPGMEARVEIASGRRRIIEYLLHPLLKGLDESFREP